MARRRSLAREWIEALPAGAFFFASEVPGEPAAVKPLLSRLASDPGHPVQRQMRGFYCKRWGDERKAPFVDRSRGALKLAGPGGGAAGLFAVNRAGWSYQHPCRYDFAVVGRPPVSPWPTVRFRRRSNVRRDALCASEVTLLEAVRYFDRSAPIPWDEAVAAVRDGSVAQSLARSGPLRPDAVLWVAQSENGMPAQFHERLGEVCGALAVSGGGRADVL